MTLANYNKSMGGAARRTGQMVGQDKITNKEKDAVVNQIKNEPAPQNQPFKLKFGIGWAIGTTIGGMAGLGYAFHKEKGFWGYVGFLILGNIVGSALGSVTDTVIYAAKNKQK